MIQLILFCLVLYLGTYYVASTSNSKYEYQLHLYEVPTTWANAGMRCSLEGGVLVSPITNSLAKEMQHIMTERRLIGSVFTGINTVLPRAINYTSIEGVPLSSTPLGWAPGEPDNAGGAEDCVAMTGAGALADVSCEDELPYFCRENKHKCGRDNGDSLEAAGFNKWLSGEPNNLSGYENCGSIDRDGILNDVACASRTFPFICERTPSESE